MTIEENGGQFIPPNNFLHGEQLNYVVEMIDAEMFGQPLYSTIADKGALYMFNIISNHIFSDGDKRTGLVTALTFLSVNGYKLISTLTDVHDLTFRSAENNYDDQLEAFTLAVASGQVTLDQCRAWFAANITPAENPG